MAWHDATRGRGAWRRGASSVRYYSRAVARLLGTIRRGRAANGGMDFSATQASVFLEGFSLRRLIQDCCREHARRMADFDADLLRRRLLPSLAEFVLSATNFGRRFADILP